MTHAYDLIGIIIGLNLIFAGWVVADVAGSRHGLASRLAKRANHRPIDSTSRNTFAVGLVLLGGACIMICLSHYR
ncbi:MAG: hypothetical protein BVN32_10755 [Proteobacteria bacterium ST_bin14]|nr:MAG: hypothetical protein BVN32_10755 [Proteobacteria bacterium ST_bin14]